MYTLGHRILIILIKNNSFKIFKFISKADNNDAVSSRDPRRTILIGGGAPRL